MNTGKSMKIFIVKYAALIATIFLSSCGQQSKNKGGGEEYSRAAGYLMPHTLVLKDDDDLEAKLKGMAESLERRRYLEGCTEIEIFLVDSNSVTARLMSEYYELHGDSLMGGKMKPKNAEIHIEIFKNGGSWLVKRREKGRAP